MRFSGLKIALTIMTALSAVGLSVPVAALNQSSATIYRLNAGGTGLAGTPQWQADTAKKPSSYVTSPSTKTAFTRLSVNTSHPSLPAGVPASMFQTQRNAPSDGSVSLAFPVESGAYEVRLFFAEVRATSMAAGSRVLDVSVEGSRVLSNYDVFQHVGGHKGVMKSFAVSSDKVLNVSVSANVGRPMLMGAEIIARDAAPTPTPTPTPTPSPEPTPTNPACSGTKVAASENLHAVVDGKSNTTFCLASGTFDLGSTPLSPGTNVTIQGATGTRSSVGAINAPTKIVGTAAEAIIAAGANNTLRWLDVSGSNPGSACQPNCGRGIRTGASMTVEYVRAHHNSNNGIGGGSPTRLTIRFSEFDHNGTADFKGTYGGVKAAATSNGGEMYIFDSYAHDNVGIGFWGDRCQQVMVVEDSLATDNSRDGIKWETNMSAGGCSNTDTRWARIQYNTALRNGDGTNADGNIKIRNSPNADVSFNVTGSGSNWGVKLIDTGVHGAFFNNQVHQNVTPDGIDHCSVTGVTCSKNTT